MYANYLYIKPCHLIALKACQIIATKYLFFPETPNLYLPKLWFHLKIMYNLYKI